MRENMGLYRGKTLGTGKWVIGSIISYNRDDGSLRSAIITGFAPLSKTVDCVAVDPSTVGEDTGLTDKNGKRIFEGDVVLFPWDDGHLHSFTIIYESGEFLAKPETETRKVWAIRISGYAKNFEVVGSVHDNPKLKGES